METPEKIIAAFLEVFRRREDLFSEEAIEDLANLDREIIQLQGRSNDEVANAIIKWCRNYSKIIEKIGDIISGERKLKPNRTDPTQYETTIRNNYLPKRYPNLDENLTKRLNSKSES